MVSRRTEENDKRYNDLRDFSFFTGYIRRPDARNHVIMIQVFSVSRFGCFTRNTISRGGYRFNAPGAASCIAVHCYYKL